MLQKKLKNKDIDFVVAYKKNKEPSKHSVNLRFILPPILLSILVFGAYGVMVIKNKTTENDITKLTEKIKILENKIASDPDAAKNKTLESILSDTDNYKKVYNMIQSYPSLTQYTFDKLTIAAGVNISITSFTYTEGSQMITLSISAKNVNDVELFVRKLKESDTFLSVTYDGYTSNSTQNSSDSKDSKDTSVTTSYTATIICVLK